MHSGVVISGEQAIFCPIRTFGKTFNLRIHLRYACVKYYYSSVQSVSSIFSPLTDFDQARLKVDFIGLRAVHLMDAIKERNELPRREIGNKREARKAFTGMYFNANI